LTRLSLGDATDANPVWTPDGRRILYSSEKDGPYQIYWKAVDGTSPEEPLLSDRLDKRPNAVTPDGTTLVFTVNDLETGSDIWVHELPPSEGRDPTPLVQTAFWEERAVLSPDGQWLAYSSNESGRAEIYARPYPGPGPRQQISADGGFSALWSPSGNEIFYRDGSRMMVVAVHTDSAGAAIAASTVLVSGEGVTHPSAKRSETGIGGVFIAILRGASYMKNWPQRHSAAGATP